MIGKEFNEKDVTDRVEVIEESMQEFTLDAKKVVNKAAARRARKKSLGITTLLKDYRKNSLK